MALLFSHLRGFSIVLAALLLAPGSVLAGEKGILSVEECRTFVEKREGVLLDARGEKYYLRSHLPGALSLPVNDFEAGYEKLRPRLEPDRNQRIVVYSPASTVPIAKGCAGCWKSWDTRAWKFSRADWPPGGRQDFPWANRCRPGDGAQG